MAKSNFNIPKDLLPELWPRSLTGESTSAATDWTAANGGYEAWQYFCPNNLDMLNKFKNEMLIDDQTSKCFWWDGCNNII